MPIHSLEAALHAHWSSDSNRRVALGVDERLGELPDPSGAATTARALRASALQQQVRAQLEAATNFEERLDLELAELMLDGEVYRDTYRWNGRTRLEQTPTAGDDIGDGIFQLFIRDPRPAAERLSDILARLEQVPEYLNALLARLDTPLARWVGIDQAKVSGLPQLFETISAWARVENFGEAAQLDRARERAELRLQEYARLLGQMPSSTELHVGASVAEGIVRARGIELTLGELHRIAREFIARVQGDIEALRARLADKYGLPPTTTVEELETALKSRFAVPLPAGDLHTIIVRYEQERDRIEQFIRERALFPLPSEQRMMILRTPRFMEPSIPAGAMLSPSPFRSGPKTSVVYLTLSDELRREHTELSIPAMMIHEGIPGHHLQLATAASHPSVIRRHVDAMDQAEGWTTMLEDYMLDVGYMGELTDEARFIGRRDISRIAGRVAIDLFFMTGDREYLDLGVPCDTSASDPFVAAASLLDAITGFVPGRIQAELNWYSLERGYPLSYLAGNHLMWRLKRDLAERQRGKLEGLELDRVFHRTLLEAGNMPLSFVRRVFQHAQLL